MSPVCGIFFLLRSKTGTDMAQTHGHSVVSRYLYYSTMVGDNGRHISGRILFLSCFRGRNVLSSDFPVKTPSQVEILAATLTSLPVLHCTTMYYSTLRVQRALQEGPGE